MSKQRMVNTKFWADDYITNLDPLERYLFLYFLTNEHTAICGVYELPLRIMAFETGLDKEMLLKILARFTKEDKVFYLNNCWVFVKNFIKHQSSESKTVKIGIENSLRLVPCDVLAQIRVIDISYAEGIDRVCIPPEVSEPEPEPEPEPKVSAAPAAPAPKKKSKKKYDDTTSMSLKEFGDWMDKSSQRHMEIVSWYADQKKPAYTTKGQWEAFIARNTRAARDLSPYTDDQIVAAFNRLKEAEKDYLKRWTIETLIKYLD